VQFNCFEVLALRKILHAVTLLKHKTARVSLVACAQVPVMLAVDRYNALYAPSEYGQTVGEHNRRMLGAEELRLARGLRVMEHTAPLKGVSIAAMARHDRIHRNTPVSFHCFPCSCRRGSACVA
jgi:hypothetical protein